MKTIAALGHRPGGLGHAWNPLQWMPAIDRLRERLSAEARQQPLRVIVGMGQGFDLMVACAALMARDEGWPITLVAALPHAGQTEAWTQEPLRRWHERLLARADAVRCFGPDQALTDAALRASYHQRDRWLLEQADEILACWSGTPRSTTGQRLAAAREAGKPIANCYDEVMAALHAGAPARRPRSA
jgi:uncharacterized phage-like protein YoqJ